MFAITAGGAEVVNLGTHGLSNRKSQDHHPRHASINSLIQRHLSAAGIPAHLEPTGIYRSDGKHPDGTSIMPWSCGRVLVWDAIHAPTHCPLPHYIGFQGTRLGGGAGRAEEEVEVCRPAGHTPLCPHRH